PKSHVLVADLYDLDGRITYFGRFLSDKLQIGLAAGKPGYVLVDRSKIDLLLEEMKLQKSGLIDESTIAEVGKMAGASVIIYGSVTDLADRIDIDVKIRDIETATSLGGTSRSLKKNGRLSGLVHTIIKSERDKERELAEYRKRVLREIEEDRERRIAAIKTEEADKRVKLESLDKEIRLKSIAITEFERRRKELERKSSELAKVHAEISRLNRTVPGRLKVGMTFKQVTEGLELDRKLEQPTNRSGCVQVGKYFLLFEGNVLARVVRNGSLGEITSLEPRRFFKGRLVVDSCSTAFAFGKNVVK
ncbi:MAG: CsgG/HfaB family protein, partial [Elusimicrobiota bacterium]